MLNSLTSCLLLAVAPLGISAQGATGCTRDFLQAAADTLVAAQTAGNPSLLAPVSSNAVYHENFKAAALTSGSLSRAVKVDHSRHSLDTIQCATYTEIISATGSKPYVIGVQLFFTDLKVSKIDLLSTTTGDWLFNATGTLNWARKEDWGVIPEAQRDSRAVIKAAGDAYCDIFSNKTVVVPWGRPCARLEGGAYTGNGGPNDRCDVGIPSGVSLVDRRYVIDETVGAVSIFLSFSGIPDSHEFRVEGGKLRFVHTITVMNTGGGSGKGKGKKRRVIRGHE
ncbi:hypothetical protein QBC35DRAFT_289914 [Podospora australis]|uniref:DUF8021 domain-containing protein n=1 Tax=Podospora australis TaxID=1536484 RepID=A0AAN7AGL9_9PEZI|nr:hypothetical protein QBC35DRAFT_289914 [Podospora australis]